MLYVNNDNLLKLDLNKMYVLADFNKTLTKGNSKTTWSILATSNLFDENYTKERNELYSKYKHFEEDETLDIYTRKKELEEWWKKHILLFTKYKLNESLISESLKEENIIELRDGVKEFLTFLNHNNIPLIIISQGIGNFAKVYLEMNNCYFDNIHIASNMIKFDDGIASGYEENIVHSLNKDEVQLPLNIIEGRNQTLLIGDELNDLKMECLAKYNQIVKIGFLTKQYKDKLSLYNQKFDVVCSDDTSYNEIGTLLFKNYIR